MSESSLLYDRIQNWPNFLECIGKKFLGFRHRSGKFEGRITTMVQGISFLYVTEVHIT